MNGKVGVLDLITGEKLMVAKWLADVLYDAGSVAIIVR